MPALDVVAVAVGASGKHSTALPADVRVHAVYNDWSVGCLRRISTCVSSVVHTHTHTQTQPCARDTLTSTQGIPRRCARL